MTARAPLRATATLALCAVALHGCGSGGDGEPNPLDAPLGTTAALLESSNVPIPEGTPAAGTVTRFRYAMPAVSGGGTTDAGALYLVPAGQVPAGGWPLVAFAHGTTGVSDACAPSSDFDALGNTETVDDLLDAGYAVVAPDYEGLGGPGVHPYYVSASHAASMVYAVRAVAGIDADGDGAPDITDGWALVGHSQGGHVVLATFDALAAAPIEDRPLLAAVALAPGVDLQTVSEAGFAAIDTALAAGDEGEALERLYHLNVNGVYAAQGLSSVLPGVEPASFYGDDVRPLLDLARDEATCFEFPQALRAALEDHVRAGGTLEDFDGLRRDWYSDSAVSEQLERDRLQVRASDVPLVIVHGTADRQIPVAAVDVFLDGRLSLGGTIDYLRLENADHGDALADQSPLIIGVLDAAFGR